MGDTTSPKRRQRGRGASAPPLHPDAPAPEAIRYSDQSYRAQLKARYVHACKQAENPNIKPREQAQYSMLAARILKDIGSVVQFDVQQDTDRKLLASAERLEELQTKGPGAGGGDTEPPFDAPETPPPH